MKTGTTETLDMGELVKRLRKLGKKDGRTSGKLAAEKLAASTAKVPDSVIETFEHLPEPEHAELADVYRDAWKKAARKTVKRLLR